MVSIVRRDLGIGTIKRKENAQHSGGVGARLWMSQTWFPHAKNFAIKPKNWFEDYNCYCTHHVETGANVRRRARDSYSNHVCRLVNDEGRSVKFSCALVVSRSHSVVAEK